jgi:hypothetical protein
MLVDRTLLLIAHCAIYNSTQAVPLNQGANSRYQLTYKVCYHLMAHFQEGSSWKHSVYVTCVSARAS